MNSTFVFAQHFGVRFGSLILRDPQGIEHLSFVYAPDRSKWFRERSIRMDTIHGR